MAQRLLTRQQCARMRKAGIVAMTGEVTDRRASICTDAAQPVAERAARAFAADTAQVIAARLPLAAAAFLTSLAGVWVIEHLVHPGRDRIYAIVFGLELLVWMLASLAARRAASVHPQRCVPIAIACGLLQVILIASYH